MDFGHALTAWAVRLSLAAYVGAVACGIPGISAFAAGPRNLHGARILWSVGALCMLVHVLAAFHFYHDWSHRRAFDETAKQTEEMLGWAFGGGIFCSYAFVVAWLADAAWWWCAPSHYAARSAWTNGPLHTFLAFIAFNGAIVFEAGVTRWVGIAVLPVLATVVYRRYRESASAQLPE